MASIILSNEELINILNANDLIPDIVTDVKAVEDYITLKLNTKSFLKPYIPITLRYYEYANDHIVLSIETDWLTRNMASLININKILNNRVKSNLIKFDFPWMYIEIHQLLDKNTKGLQVKNVVFSNGRYTIVL
ncbi:MAG: hypothetical protein K9I94_06070 [Bacteroidales bacterium]|nr:hypothetical protein [Bacteroidales bacterium]